MSTLRTRSITGVIFAAVMLAAIYGGEISSIILFGVVILFSGFELTRMLRRDVQDNWMLATLIAAILPYLLSLKYSIKGLDLKIAIVASCLIITILIFLMLFNKGAKLLEKISPITALLYLGIPFYLLRVVLLKLPFHWEMLLSIILLIWSSDSFAYLIGSKIGKRKLYPIISPGKTWEGFIGAGLCNIGISILLYYILGKYELAFFISLGLIVWLIGSLGDLFESFLKRYFKVKDSGSFLPGHGGFLDRFDSFIFVIPFVCLLMLIFEII